MSQQFDLIVIGSGTAAKNAAYACNDAGWDVAVIDSRPFGGTCVLRGCDPKKVLVGVAEAVENHNRHLEKGITSDPAEIDWSSAIAFKQTFVDGVPEATEQGLKDAGIVTFHGPARFVDEQSVQVGDERLQGEHILIATGAKPMPLPIDGQEHLTTSDEFLNLERFPDRIAFVGGGFISFEFAYMAALAGAEVHILEMMSRPLQPFDPDLVDMLVESSEDHGINVRTEAKVLAIEPNDNGFRVQIDVGGEPETLQADLVVHGAGRVPEIDDLNLEAANVDHSKDGIAVNEYLQSTSNAAVYAGGDCAATDGPPLTPVAGKEGNVAAANMLEGNHQSPDYAGTGSVVFTLPALASVGLREEEARERGLDFDVKHGDSSGWYTSQQSLVEHAGYKTLIERDTGRILGAHVFGTHAEEIINLFGLAIKGEIPAETLKEISWAYPSPTSDIQYML